MQALYQLSYGPLGREVREGAAVVNAPEQKSHQKSPQRNNSRYGPPCAVGRTNYGVWVRAVCA